MDPEIEIGMLKKTLFSRRLDSFKEISDQILMVSKKVTNSEHCYVAYVDPETRDSVGISFSHMTGACDYYAEIGEARFPVRKNGSYGGLLGYSLDTGISFYVRDPASHPASHGMPPGHEPVDQFLSVPVINEGDILGQIVLGNPEKDYNDADLELINEIADLYGVILREMVYLDKKE